MTWRPKTEIVQPWKWLGKHVPAETKECDNAVARQQILGKQPVSGRRKHITVETFSIREWTVFSVGPPRGYITGISGS
jgi:hypothetical protein